LAVLTQLGERVYVVPGGVNVGAILAGDGSVILIDTGVSETNGKKVLRAVREELQRDVSVILTTHGHADHFGANAAIVKRTGAKVFAPALDDAVLRYPVLQASSLYGGADPLDVLRTGFLLGHASPVDELVRPGQLSVGGVELDVIGLAGHSMNQVGFLIDDVFFCADVVLPQSVLAKYRIPYLYSVTDHLTALDTAEAVECRWAVPGHGPIVESLVDLIRVNRQLVLDVASAVVEICAQEQTAEALLSRVLRSFEAPVTDAAGFYLLQPTIFAFLSHLQRSGRIAHRVEHGQSLWVSV
jgi:glyoxylase-like metal-dependent hydrolase (beta-lactamase superfamily II)